MAALLPIRRSCAVAAVGVAVLLAGCSHDKNGLFPPLFSAPAVVKPVAMAVPETPAATPQTAALRDRYSALRNALLAREKSFAEGQDTLNSERQSFVTMSTEYDNRLMDGVDSATPEMQAKHALLIRRLAVLVGGRDQLETVVTAAGGDGGLVAGLQQAIQSESASPRGDLEQADLTFLREQTAILAGQEDDQRARTAGALRYWQPIIDKDRQRVQSVALLPASSATSPTPGGVSAAETMPPLPQPPAGVLGRPMLITIRFDQPNLDYTAAVKAAVSRVAGKRSAQSFDLVAITPVEDDESAHLRALDIQQIIAGTGVPLDHIHLYAETDPTVGPSEVRIYKH